MATKMITEGMTALDRVIATAMMSGLALALVEYARVSSLPAHFV